ncbi:hypothetical protein [Roseovarius sp. 217]|uniref:hypothetical protein n=1 Tax=Roseovarius sp. (strain 217) TaxID=314264 RepID=UPI0000685A67|nr:hypothetical protein [Roseovarius sp. 217]EAQ26844.1 hypothetical protein ROS217_19997 [Roseovarius sp. 217]
MPLDNEPALYKLQALQDPLGKLLIVYAAHQRPKHISAVGGGSRFKYLDGATVDIYVAGHDPITPVSRSPGRIAFRLDPI